VKEDKDRDSYKKLVEQALKHQKEKSEDQS